MVPGTVRRPLVVREPDPGWEPDPRRGRDRVAALLELGLLPGIGPRRVLELERRFGGAVGALSASRERFAAVAGPAAADARGAVEIRDRVLEALSRCEALEIRAVCRGDPGYPSALEELHDPPPVIFLRGDPALLEERRRVAVVGARRATGYGRRVARELAEELSRAGVVVVSGLALGIDGAAHYGALDATGETIAVLGSGPDVPHPRSHGALYRRVVESGLVVSEFMPGEPARPHHFPRRNRILAGLSAGVVVVEAARRSGAFITVDHALDLGREVFAVPGPVDSSRSRGVHALLREGARVVTRASDVLEDLGWAEEPGSNGGARGSEPRLAGDQAPVWAALRNGPVYVDEVSRLTGVSASDALTVLSGLEIRGWVTRLPGGRFVRRAGTTEESP